MKLVLKNDKGLNNGKLDDRFRVKSGEFTMYEKDGSELTRETIESEIKARQERINAIISNSNNKLYKGKNNEIICITKTGDVYLLHQGGGWLLVQNYFSDFTSEIKSYKKIKRHHQQIKSVKVERH
jgi:hypothetical protein